MDAFFRQAIELNDASALDDLLRRGADIDTRDRYGQTGLMLAAHAGRREVVALLIERGADLNVTAKSGLSALMLSIIAGHEEIARLLAHAGADLSLTARGWWGKTAHDLASDRGMHTLAGELAKMNESNAAARAREGEIK